ncbi:MAG: lytic transglycosylase domain-containing protein [Jiangellaceae bacterium]
MRIFKVDIPVKRAEGRHRRLRQRRSGRPSSASAIAAVVAVGLFAGVSSGPTTDTLLGKADVEPADISGRVSEDVNLERFLDPEHLSAVPVGPGDVAEPVQAVLSGARVIDALGESGIPLVAQRAYQNAASALATDDESCGLQWTLLAAIGRVESNHGRFGGAQLREDGSGTKLIRGIPLDGRPNVALIRDTDGGALDGDTTYDRAVGPMQFIPSTWRSVGADANADGRRDPNNIYDAALGAAVYLCTGDTDLRDPNGAARAVRRYNNADEYVRVVLSLAELYETGVVDVVPSSPLPPPANRSTPANTTAPSVAPRPPTPPAPAVPPAPVGTEPALPAPEVAAPAPPATPRPEATTPAEPALPDETTPAETAPPEATTPAEPVPEVEPPPTAAVGWAPAMREAVLSVLEETPVPPVPTPVAPS